MSPKNVLRSPIRLAVAALAIVAVALVITACGSSGSKSSDSSSDTGATSASSSTAASGSGDTVTIKLIAYKPAKLTVAPGTSVTWDQTDPGVHTVTSGTVEQAGGSVTVHPDGTFDSGELATGKHFTQKFDAPGTHTYFCRIHPATMQAEVTVK